MNYDFSTFSGHWPFRRIRNHDLSRQLSMCGGLGISGGVMSSLEAIFYNDPWEADLPLLEALPEHWQLAMCVNPSLPRTEAAVEDAHSRGVRFLRLYPCIHDYPLDDACLHRVCAPAARLGMTVILTARMEDDRLCYLLRQRPVPIDDCLALARKYPGTRFLLSGFYLAELTQALPLPENLWADTAGLCHGLDPVTTLIDAGFPAEKLVFGSFSPLQCADSHLLNLPGNRAETILSQNGQSLLEVSE